MTSAPATDWLEDEFERTAQPRRHDFHDPLSGQPRHGPTVVRYMIQLISVLDTGEPMHVTQADYADPDRRWL
jgi:hypothetical protein